MAANIENAVIFNENFMKEVLKILLVFTTCEKGYRETVKSFLIKSFSNLEDKRVMLK